MRPDEAHSHVVLASKRSGTAELRWIAWSDYVPGTSPATQADRTHTLETHPRALLLDDDVSVGYSLLEALASFPVTLELAHEVGRAIELLSTQSYCALVLDLELPDGSGFDVLRFLSERSLHVPTIVITRKLPDYVRELLIAEDIKLVLPKPIDSSLLASALLGLCGIET